MCQKHKLHLGTLDFNLDSETDMQKSLKNIPKALNKK